jgi:hypothetical protein
MENSDFFLLLLFCIAEFNEIYFLLKKISLEIYLLYIEYVFSYLYLLSFSLIIHSYMTLYIEL